MKKILFLSIVLMTTVLTKPLFAQKRDFEDEKRRSLQNERRVSIMSCSPIENKPSKVFVDPDITTDTLADEVAPSWSFSVHTITSIGGKKYYKGNLVSSRGGHQPDIGFIDPLFWNCLKKK